MWVRCLAMGLAVWGLGLAGCASQGAGEGAPSTQKSTCLRVSGAPGTRFTATYRVGGTWDTVTVTLTRRTPTTTVVKGAGDDLECDIRKKDKAMDLTVEIIRQERCLFRGHILPGSEGMRVAPFWGGWRSETY